MLDVEKQNRHFLKVIDSLRMRIGSYNLYSNIVYLLFLKYIIMYSDQLEYLGIEGYKTISVFKRKYDLARIGVEPLTIEDINEVMLELDKDSKWGKYHFSDSIRNYGELFGDLKTQQYILNSLDNICINYDIDSLKLFLELLISRCMGDVKKTSISMTNKSLRSLVSKILIVKDNETYLDCYSGFSSTLLDIDNYKYYIGYEVIAEIALVSRMILIMCNKNNFDIISEDFLEANTHEIADKVFSDGPLLTGSSLYRDSVDKYGIKTKDVDLISLYKVLDSVKTGGMAAITVPGRVLFSESFNYRQMRKSFVEHGLKSVISLPPLWTGYSINTNLLIIEKGYKGNVVFIEAKNLGISDKKAFILSNDTIEKITETIWNPENTNGFSQIVDYRDVISHSTWLPSFYIKPIVNADFRSVQTIDDELNKLYAELKNNL